MKHTVKIDYKLPSLNDYVKACRTNHHAGNQMKKKVQREISHYLFKNLNLKVQLKGEIKTPVRLHFTWLEKTRRRDIDNVAFAKKFVLDALVNGGWLPDDGVKHVVGFTDEFEYGKEWGLILVIEELNIESYPAMTIKALQNTINNYNFGPIENAKLNTKLETIQKEVGS